MLIDRCHIIITVLIVLALSTCKYNEIYLTIKSI